MTPSRNIWAILPVKDSDRAKERLASCFGPEFRRGLVQAMVEDVLSALAAAPGLAGIAVVTCDAWVAALARVYGAAVFEDGARDGYTGAVMAACRRLASEGKDGVLCVPADIPGITALEVGRLLEFHRPGRAFTIVPAHDKRGSNAILMTPPDLMPLAYGADSFVLHLANARRIGIDPQVVELPGIGLDIDTPHDIDLLARVPAATRTHRYIEHHGIPEHADD